MIVKWIVALNLDHTFLSFQTQFYVGRTEYKTIGVSMSNIYLMLFQFNDGRLLTWTMDGIIIYGKSLKLRMLQ